MAVLLDVFENNNCITDRGYRYIQNYERSSNSNNSPYISM